MSKKSGGGSATNAGVEYQQRVAAWFLTTMLAKRPIADVIKVPNAAPITRVSFETAHSIDDLSLLCENGLHIFLQVKRSASLSSSATSEFYKSIEQFVRQYLSRGGGEEAYVLAVSPSASGRLTRELRKALESIRLNDESFSENPLNQSEQSSFTTYKTVVENLFRAHAKAALTEAEFVNFSRRVFILVFDVEGGAPLEQAALVILSGHASVEPSLIWDSLISNSLYYATNRLSINREGLFERFGKYLREAGRPPEPAAAIDELIKTSVEMKGAFSSGKEVVLVADFPKKNALMVAEMFRFTDDCSRKFKFSGDKLFLGGGAVVWSILHRCSTMAGMERFLSENIQLLEGGELAIAPAKGIEDVESSACARIHSDFCKNLLDGNKSLLRCLHCGKRVSEDRSYNVEIDDADFPAAVGLVHRECLRPIDRVLGEISTGAPSFLRRFDPELWLRSLFGGQYLFRGMKGVPSSASKILWNPNVEYDPSYNYCMKFILEDGSSQYITQRGRIVRVPEARVGREVEEYRQALELAKAANNPFCYTSEQRIYGTYDSLLGVKGEAEKILECVAVEPARYSRLIRSSEDEPVNFYAPLIMLMRTPGEEPFTIQGHVVFLNNPMSLPDYIENWGKAGIEVGTYNVEIIQDDKVFDNRMRAIMSSGQRAVFNPLVNLAGEIHAGLHLVDINDAPPVSA